VTAALERVYGHLLAHGDSTGLPASESYGFGRMCELMGFPDAWAFESTWATRAEHTRAEHARAEQHKEAAE
jgi:hypothetical protein